jgi:vacuolar-type H+-ATPase catalytic subunit A/Vma1
MNSGRVNRIAGPIIHATGLGSAGLFDVVDVGPN